ncbi:deoxynucleotide monophosphate kinase [Aquamicrobium soli]|uniref:Deoxynucleotide monophosphate kinase n=1 Tax=Aquamicrobium soli TaxID=1811518 RepID=A0ABV7K9A4_9HYPH
MNLERNPLRFARLSNEPRAVIPDGSCGELWPINIRPAANDNAPRVIALSGAAGSGKSTAADYLVRQYGYERIKFAGPLKDAMRALGLTDYHIEGEGKERPCLLLQGKTPRYAMQTIGTQWGRDLIGPHFWVGLWEARANEVLDSGGRVVVDDCRFPNEAEAVRKLGGVVVRLVGRGGIGGGHSSETMDWEADRYVYNDTTRERLYEILNEVAA